MIDRKRVIHEECNKRGLTKVSISKKFGIPKEDLDIYFRFNSSLDVIVEKKLAECLGLTEDQLNYDFPEDKPKHKSIVPEYEISEKAKKQYQLLESLVDLAAMYYDK